MNDTMDTCETVNSSSEENVPGQPLNPNTSDLQFKVILFNTLMKYIPDSITVKNAQLRFLMVNDTWASNRNLTDTTAVINKTDADFFSEAVAEKFSRKDRQVLKNKEPQINAIEKIDEDAEHSHRVSMTRLPVVDPENGEIIALIGISRDISTRTQIEKELAYERDMLHTLLDHSRDAIYFKDLESRYLRISRAHPAMRVLDTPEQAIGKTDFDYFSIEHAKQAFNDEKRIIATGEPILGIIEHETGPGIPERWVFTSKLPMYNKNGAIIGTFGLSRDISDIKKYENELHRAKLELEERVNQRTSDLQAANKNLEQRIAQLDFLTTASYEMAHCTDLNDIAFVIMRCFVARLHTTAGTFCIKNGDHFTCISAIGINGHDSVRGIIEESVSLLHLDDIKHPVIIDEWQSFYPQSAELMTLKASPTLAVFPLFSDNRLIGILHIFSDGTLHDRLIEEEKVLLTLAAHSAVSLSNALYYKELGEKVQLQAELDAARSIQQRLTPRFSPDIPGIRLKGLYSPAYEVGGDYLDYFKNDAGCWVVVIADVCGKGIPAALLMTLLRSAFRVEARTETSSKRLLCSVNNSMQANLDDRSFVTALCLIIRPDGKSMTYARAGHPRLLKIDPKHGFVESYQSDGIALGILPDLESFSAAIDELTIQLFPGDHFFIYTDGLTEAFDPQKNTYGTERLMGVLKGYHGSAPEQLIDTVIKDIKIFTQGAPYHDDLTLIALSVDYRSDSAPRATAVP